MESNNARVRAIIITQKKLLLIHRVRKSDNYYIFPGGGVDEPESKEEALIRECKEELGVDVQPEKLFRMEISQKPEIKGQEEYFYFTKIYGGVLGNVTGPEFDDEKDYEGKYIHEWHDISDIKNIDLRPNKVRDELYDYLNRNEKN